MKWIHGYTSECKPYWDSNIQVSNTDEDFVVITKELFEMILFYILEEMFSKIYEIVSYHEEYDDNQFHDKYRVYMLLYCIYTYLSSIVSDGMDEMILLSYRIKKVLKRDKNKGFRDVLLGNSQVWRLKRKKEKGFYGRQIRRRNKKTESLKKKYREKSVSYYPIKRLDKEYEVIIS